LSPGNRQLFVAGGPEVQSFGGFLRLVGFQKENERFQGTGMEPMRLLYLEDETSIFNLVQDLLKNAQPDGFQLRRAVNLQEGLEILSRESFDLILLDLDLPDSHGLETLKRTHAHCSSLPIVVLTGIGDETVAEQVLEWGAQDFLEKMDLRSNTLARALRYALERKRDREAREVLEENERKLRALFHNLLAGVFLIDAESHMILEANDQAVKMTGGNRENLIGAVCHQFICPTEIGQCPLSDLNQAVDHSERLLLTAQGEQKAILKSVSTITLNGRPHFVESFIDISDRKRAEEELIESEQRYRNLVENISEGMLELDERGVATFCNQRMAEILGYDQSEIVNVDSFKFVEPYSRDSLNREWQERRKGKVGRYESILVRKDGARVPLMVFSSPLWDEQGKFKGALVIMSDITERKMLESQLLQSQKMEAVGQLAAGIAHEINTPTQYVTDNIQFLESSFGGLLDILREYESLRGELGSGPELSKKLFALEARSRVIDLEYLLEEIPLALSQTREGLGRITRIVRSMKEFAHPGLETKALLNLNQAIETTVTVARNEWKYVAEVETVFDPDLPSVFCIPGQINQVLLNILVNAAQAIAGEVEDKSDQKGKIEIRTIKKDREVEVRISDTGPGIPSSIRDRIFEPFFTTKEPGKGTGQGLSIAHRIIIRNHQGQLSVDSGPEQGTTFIIKLPIGDGEGPLV
jgi:two-component system, NtrC family, sensor kinase